MYRRQAQNRLQLGLTLAVVEGDDKVVADRLYPSSCHDFYPLALQYHRAGAVDRQWCRLCATAFPAHSLLRVHSGFRCTLVEVILTILQPQLPDTGPVAPVGRAHLGRGRLRDDPDQPLVTLFKRWLLSTSDAADHLTR